MILERRLKKRGMFGYNPKEVRAKLEEVQGQYMMEQKLLQTEIAEEKHKNKKLQAYLTELQKLPIKSTISDDINTLFTGQFFQQTSEIRQLKMELESEEMKLKEELAKKKQLKEAAQNRLEEALHYLTKLQNDLREELDK